MGNRVRKDGGRVGTIIAIVVVTALAVAGLWFGWTRYQSYRPVSNLSQRFSISFPKDARAIVSKEEESFHGDGYRYVKITADPEKVNGTILDGREYSSNRLSQESIRMVKEANTTLQLDLGTQLDDLYEQPHRKIDNENGTLIIIRDADSSEWHFFECLI
ncbi:hypothetical protein [Bifidobacterium miconisargentati]|uniref:hypothetical protein n=1 Tax=Bifidobacterium miconisargentati TaxID=2834437 RepID=UPI001F40E946|nr:hypothetical protein [Bifidobacterium miconisargentati]